jgi:hypothetical protein
MSSPVATQQHIAPSRAEPLNDHLRLSLADHGVGFIVPAGARFAGELDLPCGALVHGVLHGRIRCEQGSLIFAPGSEFAGEAHADMVYVCGEVKSQRSSAPSVITGKMLVSVSRSATGRAQLASKQFAICSSRFAGTMHSLD